jgi:hypothetical protein
MTHDHEHDSDLRERFAAQRAHEASQVPALGRILAPRRSPRAVLGPAFALGTLALVFAAVLVWRRTDAPVMEGPFAVVPGELRVPTDYFLEIGGTVRAGEVPAIGAVDWYPLMPGASGRPDASSRRN